MVINGIDRIGEYEYLFRGKRLGMVTCAAALTRDMRPGYLAVHEKFPLHCLFSPEHGLHGRFGNGEAVCEDSVDLQTGAAVISLFGNWTVRHIPDYWLHQLDAVIYDIQDLGTRFYTFIATMIRVMEDCAEAGRELIILDRPAVLGGEVVEGGIPDPRYRSFVAPYSLPIRYGLTVGELARMVNDEEKLNCCLHVVPCEGWDRRQMFPDYGACWVKPSGAITDFETALLYPGLCLFEGTNLSEGRGTGAPFRLVGAPFVDGQRLSREMNDLELPGVHFACEVFCPVSSKYRNQTCEGVSLRVTEPSIFRSIHTGVSLLYKIRELYPGTVSFSPCPWSPEPHIRFLAGGDWIDQGSQSLELLLRDWERDCEAFRERKRKYHIYGHLY